MRYLTAYRKYLFSLGGFTFLCNPATCYKQMNDMKFNYIYVRVVLKTMHVSAQVGIEWFLCVVVEKRRRIWGKMEIMETVRTIIFHNWLLRTGVFMLTEYVLHHFRLSFVDFLCPSIHFASSTSPFNIDLNTCRSTSLPTGYHTPPYPDVLHFLPSSFKSSIKPSPLLPPTHIFSELSGTIAF
jgi:hypothetical protein